MSPWRSAGVKDCLRRVNEALRQIEERKDAVISADVARVEKKLVAARRCENRVRLEVMKARAGKAARANRTPIEDVPRVRAAKQRVDKLENELELVLAGQGPALKKMNVKANPSDPDTRPMPINSGHQFIQGYNAQISVSDDHVILTTTVTQDTNDVGWFVPVMNDAVTIAHLLDPDQVIGTILADAGYLTLTNLSAPGPDRLIAVGQDPNKCKARTTHPSVKAMAQRLSPGSSDRELYARRAATVETVNAHLKNRIGLRRFSRRGLKAANNELALAAMAHNLLRLHQHTNKQQNTTTRLVADPIQVEKNPVNR